MDQHPIPQDVTGFQFKLIGNMTVKQFGFVAVGVVSAVILYYLPLHFALSILVKMLLIPTFGASGFIIAFLPIDGRPIDVMAGNFIKAFLAPNQYVYHKVGYTFSFSNLTLAKAPAVNPDVQRATTSVHQQQINRKELQLQMFLQNSQRQVKNSLDEKEFAFLKNITTTAAPVQTTTGPLIHTQPLQHVAPQVKTVTSPYLSNIQTNSIHTSFVSTPQNTTPMHVAPAAPHINPVPNNSAPMTQQVQSQPMIQHLGMPTQTISQPVVQSQPVTQQPIAQPQATHPQSSALEQQIQQMHEEKQRLEQELLKLKEQHAAQQTVVAPAVTPSPVTPTASAQPVQQVAQQPTMQQAPQISARPVQNAVQPAAPAAKNTSTLHIPDTPNILVGIVKDARGNILPRILLEVKDKDGNPVRAFKTNALGQFASATPLANGVYTIELEDPKRQNMFDPIQLIANNKIILPLEIVSHDAREQLRRELFN